MSNDDSGGTLQHPVNVGLRSVKTEWLLQYAGLLLPSVSWCQILIRWNC